MVVILFSCLRSNLAAKLHCDFPAFFQRSAPSLDKRSVFDMFDKFDLNGDSKLEFHEIAYFFFNNFHFSLNEAERYAQQQLNNFDINKDGVLDIWGKGAFLTKVYKFGVM